MKIKKLLVLFPAIFAGLVVTGQTKVSSQDALKSIESGYNNMVIDVRTAGEFQTSHLKNAINIDWMDNANFEKAISIIPKNKKLYVYCKSGGRSSQAAAKLAELGYEVFEIEGGIVNWKADNLPTVTVSKASSKGLSMVEYATILKENNVVLVYFTAAWCGPCKQLSPIVKSIESDYKEKVKVLILDVDQNEELAVILGIRNIPVIQLFNKESKEFEQIGFITAEDLKNEINKLLTNSAEKSVS